MHKKVFSSVPSLFNWVLVFMANFAAKIVPIYLDSLRVLPKFKQVLLSTEEELALSRGCLKCLVEI